MQCSCVVYFAISCSLRSAVECKYLRYIGDIYSTEQCRILRNSVEYHRMLLFIVTIPPPHSLLRGFPRRCQLPRCLLLRRRSSPVPRPCPAPPDAGHPHRCRRRRPVVKNSALFVLRKMDFPDMDETAYLGSSCLCDLSSILRCVRGIVPCWMLISPILRMCESPIHDV